MFTLLPNTTAPLAGLLAPEGVQFIVFALVVATLAILLAFGVSGSDGIGADGFGDFSDGDGGCSAD